MEAAGACTEDSRDHNHKNEIFSRSCSYPLFASHFVTNLFFSYLSFPYSPFCSYLLREGDSVGNGHISLPCIWTSSEQIDLVRGVPNKIEITFSLFFKNLRSLGSDEDFSVRIFWIYWPDPVVYILSLSFLSSIKNKNLFPCSFCGV